MAEKAPARALLLSPTRKRTTKTPGMDSLGRDTKEPRLGLPPAGFLASIALRGCFRSAPQNNFVSRAALASPSTR